MALVDFLRELDDEVSIVNSSEFDIEIIETEFVPSFSDSDITYDNVDDKKKKCKRLESCVLYVDIRGSVKISAKKQPKTLAKMYSSFVRSMIACARYYGGHVRNIIGDRVMVVFDRKDCFTKAVDTAILMNSVCKYILNKKIKSFDFSAGIGIDYGKMLITKAGAIRQGDEKEFYRSLVWLGKPANIASRLTDLAHKKETFTITGVKEGVYFPLTKSWSWTDATFKQFVNRLEVTNTRNLKHKNAYFNSFYQQELGPYHINNKPILMTKSVYDGFRKANPDRASIKNKWWSKSSIEVKDYDGEVYAGNVIFTDIENI